MYFDQAIPQKQPFYPSIVHDTQPVLPRRSRYDAFDCDSDQSVSHAVSERPRQFRLIAFRTHLSSLLQRSTYPTTYISLIGGTTVKLMQVVSMQLCEKQIPRHVWLCSHPPCRRWICRSAHASSACKRTCVGCVPHCRDHHETCSLAQCPQSCHNSSAFARRTEYVYL